jgi:CheY-like chemotaxis protein
MLQHRQVLIVEDDPDTRVALGALLEMHGFSPAFAVNGADGLSQLRAGMRPRVIVLDLMMPEKNGLQFRVEQVVDPTLADIPVIVYSGNLEALSDSGVLNGVARLRKPVDVPKLLQLIEQFAATDAGNSPK